MTRWASVVRKDTSDGGVSESRRVHKGDDASAVSGAAIQDAHFWKQQNPGNNCRTWAEELDD